MDLLVLEPCVQNEQAMVIQRSISVMLLVFCSLGPKHSMTLPHCSVSAPTLVLKPPKMIICPSLAIRDSGLKQGVESFSLSCYLWGNCLRFCWCICCDDSGIPHVQLEEYPQDSQGCRMEDTPSVLTQSHCIMAK